MAKGKHLLTSVFFMLTLASACKKDAGVVGKKVVKGVVTYANGFTGNNDVAAGALVHIAYGTTSAVGSYDQTVLTDAGGNYSIPGLRRGEYFITAEFTDAQGFHYTVPGYSVTINDKKSELSVDILLK